MYEVTDDMPAHARVTLLEPVNGWSRAHYEREIAQYTRDRGAPPHTVTLHPDTMVTLELQTSRPIDTRVGRSRDPMVISSSTYARDRITLFE